MCAVQAQELGLCLTGKTCRRWRQCHSSTWGPKCWPKYGISLRSVVLVLPREDHRKNLLSFYDIFSNKLLLEKSFLPFPLLTSERVIVDINSTKKFDTIVTNDDTLLENFLLVENNSVGGFLLHFNLCLLDISFFDPLSNEHLVTNSP